MTFLKKAEFTKTALHRFCDFCAVYRWRLTCYEALSHTLTAFFPGVANMSHSNIVLLKGPNRYQNIAHALHLLGSVGLKSQRRSRSRFK